MPWCGRGELVELWGAAGIDGARAGEIVVGARYDGFDDLWAPFPTGVGPAGAYCASLEPDLRAALRDAYRRRLSAGAAPFDGTHGTASGLMFIACSQPASATCQMPPWPVPEALSLPGLARA